MRFRILMLLAVAGFLWGQRPPAPEGPPPPRPEGPQAGRGMQAPPGKWWDRPEMVKKLGISADQRRKMDDVFQQTRVKLIDLHAALDKEEATMEPLMQAAQPDDAKILPQIDRIAQARADLEKAEARLMLALRHVLTPEQWDLLQSDRRTPNRPHNPGRE